MTSEQIYCYLSGLYKNAKKEGREDDVVYLTHNTREVLKNNGKPGVFMQAKRSDKTPEIDIDWAVFCRICLWNATWYALHGNHKSYVS